MRVERVAKTLIALGMLSLAAGPSGCSRGISGSTDHATSNTPPTNCGVANSGVAYLFFSTSDATCPGKPLAVDAGTDALSNIFYLAPATVFVAGIYDSATRTVNDVHNYALVYAKTSGNFYKVSALKSSGTPTPTQLSSENSAGKICPTFAPTDAPTEAVDLANPDHSQIVYHTPGKNEICNDADDVYKMVRLDMGAADAPITAKQPIGTALHDWTTGAISGWLVNDAGALKKCEANFANCLVASSLEIKNYTSQVSIAGSNRWLVDIDHRLYVYDGDTNTLSAEIHTMVDEIRPLVTAVINDSNRFYFSTGKAPQEIYSAPVDGSASATRLVTATANINGLALSANKLLYWTNTGINAVSKTSGAVIPLVTGSSLITMAAVNANHVYYTAGINEAHPIAGSVNDDGNLKVETPDASWQGFSIVTSWNLTDGFATISQAQTVIRAEGYNALGIGKGFGGAKLYAFDAATATQVALVGTVPTDVVRIYCSSSGANVLCNGSNASLQNDIFLLNAATLNSLVRVTDTPTKSEFLIN